jgi:hypothetical protein
MHQAKASWRRAREVKATHSCMVCEGRAPQPSAYARQCPVVRIHRDADTGTVKELKKRGIWQGPIWYERLRALYGRTSEMLNVSGDQVAPYWPVRLALAADVILSARSAVRCEEMA